MTGDHADLEIHPYHRGRRFTLRGLFRDREEATRRSDRILEAGEDVIVFAEEAPSGDEIFHLAARKNVTADYDPVLPDPKTALGEAVRVAVSIFTDFALTAEKEDRGVPWYKELETQRLWSTINRWDWSGTRAEVGADILTKTIRAHPFPNANHRTSILLARSYLHAAGVPWPAEKKNWYEYGDAVHRALASRIPESKFLLLLRRRQPMIKVAYEEGYRRAKIGGDHVQIKREHLELDRDGLQGRHRRLCHGLIVEGAEEGLEDKLAEGNVVGLKRWVQFAQNR